MHFKIAKIATSNDQQVLIDSFQASINLESPKAKKDEVRAKRELSLVRSCLVLFSLVQSCLFLFSLVQSCSVFSIFIKMN